MWVLKTQDHQINKSLAVCLKEGNVMNIQREWDIVFLRMLINWDVLIGYFLNHRFLSIYKEWPIGL